MTKQVPTGPQYSRREALLLALLRAKPAGLTLGELSEGVGVTRTAVSQHVIALERDGLVEQIGVRPSGRRPSRTYGLSERGLEAFPRRYDLLSTTMLGSLRARLGDEAAEGVLMDMAESLAARWLTSLLDLPAAERRLAVVEKLQELGYHAHLTADGQGVEALNCIYHRVASETRAVCRFDERLVSLLLGSEVRLTSCMADGERKCVFAPSTRVNLEEERPSG